MKNTIYLDGDFNFLLLENEEEDNGLTQTKIYINIPTSAAANQALDISVAGGTPITESIPSSAKVNFELSQQYWADNGDVEITPKNDDITGDTITIHFPGIFTTSAALNYIADDEFELLAQEESFAEEGSGSGSGSGGGSSFDFVETIRNIGFRLLDEPSNVNAYFDEAAGEVQIKWTDPDDISTNEPVACTWAGTVVVRKEGSAPRHRWDGTLIVDSTTRNQYSSTALVDSTAEGNKEYYYGIFPYYIGIHSTPVPVKYYRFTKVVKLLFNVISHVYHCIETYLFDGNTVDLSIINDFSILNPVIESTSVTASVIGFQSGVPSFFDDLGDVIYHNAAPTDDTLIFFENEYLKIAFGKVDVINSIPFYGVLIYNKTNDTDIVKAGWVDFNDGKWADFYISIILDTPFERGYIVLTERNYQRGYAEYIVGGTQNGVDIIWESFKDLA